MHLSYIRTSIVTHSDVENLQRYLMREGFFKAPQGATGFFGAQTKEALLRWQEAVEVPSTGGFGDLSRRAYLQQTVCALTGTVQAITFEYIVQNM